MTDAITQLFATIEARKQADAGSSYTAQLLHKGTAHIARKFGEEAVELIIASTAQGRDAALAEAGDVLYHLAVLLASQGIGLPELQAELNRRTGQSGLEEKNSRPAQ
jgi:phosphoribosyl-ATP pyrophosphohydrolase